MTIEATQQSIRYNMVSRVRDLDLPVSIYPAASSVSSGTFLDSDLEGTHGQDYIQYVPQGPARHPFFPWASFSTDRINSLVIKKSNRSETMVDELDDIFEECSQANWDGYGAKRVYRSLRKTVERFLDALPSSIPDPELSPDPDGEISLDWCYDKDKAFSISIGRRELTYAVLDGERRSRGVEIFEDEIPESIIIQLNKFLSDKT